MVLYIETQELAWQFPEGKSLILVVFRVRAQVTIVSAIGGNAFVCSFA